MKTQYSLREEIRALAKPHRGRSMRFLNPQYSLREEIEELARNRICSALLLCNGNKTAAAELLGLSSYQTLTNWMVKYGVENGA
jgi:transcriptional regulator with GAF, ATPase, and Fis domain